MGRHAQWSTRRLPKPGCLEDVKTSVPPLCKSRFRGRWITKRTQLQVDIGELLFGYFGSSEDAAFGIRVCGEMGRPRGDSWERSGAGKNGKTTNQNRLRMRGSPWLADKVFLRSFFWRIGYQGCCWRRSVSMKKGRAPREARGEIWSRRFR